MQRRGYEGAQHAVATGRRTVSSRRWRRRAGLLRSRSGASVGSATPAQRDEMGRNATSLEHRTRDRADVTHCSAIDLAVGFRKSAAASTRMRTCRSVWSCDSLSATDVLWSAAPAQLDNAFIKAMHAYSTCS